MKAELHKQLLELEDFGNVGIQEKVNQLLRFYKAKKKNV